MRPSIANRSFLEQSDNDLPDGRKTKLVYQAVVPNTYGRF